MSTAPCLIVEDEPNVRAIISRVLKGYGLAAAEFAGVGEALASITCDSPKVIFLDVSLEGSDAVDAIRGLAERKFGGTVQLMSGRGPTVLEEINKIGERRGLRMRPPIAKPFSGDAIRQVVKEEGLCAPVLSLHPVPLVDALRHGWWELWYQPKIDLRTKTIVGAEALSRVRHPDHGLIAPRAFLANATPEHLAELTKRVIVTALQDWTVFAETGAPLKLAVNVPLSAFATLPLPAIVREHRPKSDQWPGIIFEVTETEMEKDIELVREVATQLSLYDVSLSIDDFGSAYSSMKRLCDLPCAELKLDRSLVRNCAADERNAKICANIIALGHDLGMSVVAEGLEKTSELRAFQNMGCDLGQGFLFSPAQERDRLISEIHLRPRVLTQHSAQS
jgi:EAL domain-containing protein (putative c-di-GMP-specific phosphodiesterase class I)